MNQNELFNILQEGKPNSLGKTLEIYNKIINNQLGVMEVYHLYKIEDRIVSMRVSNILKRLWREDLNYILPIIDQFIVDAKELLNPTFRWTLAQLFKELFKELNDVQKKQLLIEIQRNFQINDDWIMLSQSIDALVFARSKKFEILNINIIIDKLDNDHRVIIQKKVKKLKELFEI
jgi:hypothetical protein